MNRRFWVAAAAVVVVAVGVVAFIADGRSVSGPPSVRLEAWAKATGLGQDIGVLQADAAAVYKAASQHRATAAFHTVCSAMATAAQTDNDSLPSPDTVVTQDLAKAYGFAYDAAQECYKAGASDAALLARSERTSQKARSLFEAVVRRIGSVTGTPLSTTTTTVPGSTATTFL